MTRPIRAHRRPDDGAAAVEFAIVSLLLMTILLGIIQYGFYFFQTLSAQRTLDVASELAVNGARAADVNPADGLVTCEEYRAAVMTAASFPGLQPGDIAWEATQTGPLETGHTIDVTIRWDPVSIAGGLIPYPRGEHVEVARRVVTHPGSGPMFTDDPDADSLVGPCF